VQTQAFYVVPQQKINRAANNAKELGLVKVQLGAVRAKTLDIRRTTPLLLSGLLALCIGAAGHYLIPYGTTTGQQIVAAAAPVVAEIEQSAPVQAASQAAADMHAMAQAAMAPKPELVSREVELASSRSFASMLTDSDVDPQDALAVSTALSKVYDQKKLKAGQEVTLTFTRLGQDETLKSLVFQPELTKEVSITRESDGTFKAVARVTPIERERVAARGEIRSSLYEAGAREGVPRAVMAALIRAYSHAIDFQRDIHPGDKFEVLYDQPTAHDGTPVGQGVIIYAAIQQGSKVLPLYRVTFGDGTVDYFDERGKSVKRALLRTPVDGARMTSGFGMRMHPLLGYSKMHQGVDFGAPTGTPIFAAGSGVVEEAGWKGSYGKFVLLRHNGRLETAYAHMSRYARGVYPGARVNQGDVIGFVGTTGRSTGAHLHFEVRVDRHQINPLSVNMPTGRVLEGQALTQFKQGQSRIKKEFSTLLSKDDETTTKAEAGAPSPVVKASTDKAVTERTSGKI
jgi:murein DD-endopeptidase MepM/ murein hydrolase activator NlpD